MTYSERLQKSALIALLVLAVLTLVGALLAGAGLLTGYLTGFGAVGVAICGLILVLAKCKTAKRRTGPRA